MALIAVPDNRLVTSELHRRRNVTIGVRVLIHFSPFLIFRAPVLESTSVSSNVFLGIVPCSFRVVDTTSSLLLLFFLISWNRSATLVNIDLRIKSSTVFLKSFHQLSVFLQDSHLLQSQSAGSGGASGKVVWDLYILESHIS